MENGHKRVMWLLAVAEASREWCLIFPFYTWCEEGDLGKGHGLGLAYMAAEKHMEWMRVPQQLWVRLNLFPVPAKRIDS